MYFSSLCRVLGPKSIRVGAESWRVKKTSKSEEKKKKKKEAKKHDAGSGSVRLLRRREKNGLVVRLDKLRRLTHKDEIASRSNGAIAGDNIPSADIINNEDSENSHHRDIIIFICN